MKAEVEPRLPEIFRPVSNVLLHQSIDIMTSGAEQSNNISGSVLPRFMDFPIPIHFFQMLADYHQLFAMVFRANLMNLAPLFREIVPPVVKT